MEDADDLLAAMGAAGDRRALASLYDHFAPRLMAILCRLGANEAAAEAVVEGAMLTVWRQAGRFDPARAEAAAWVFAIARDQRRHRRPHIDHDDDPPAAPDGRRLRAALAALPAEQAEMLRLVFFDDHPHDAIARRLAVPLGTVTSRLRLAARRLRQPAVTADGVMPVPRHHPTEATLIAYGAGNLAEAPVLVLAAHLTRCPACRRQVGDAEAIGGVLLDQLAPLAISPGALDRLLARLDDSPPPPPARPDPPSLAGRPLPAPLGDYLAGPLDDHRRWRRQGRRISELPVLAGARLLRLAPGTTMARHGHAGGELTLVLEGGLDDGPIHYQAGDLADRDEETIHQPASAEGCLCLVAQAGPLRVTGLVARLLGRF